MVGLLTRNNLIDPETALVDAAMTGTWWTRPPDDPGGDDPAHGERWGPARTIRAQVLYQLLTGRGNLCSDEDHDEVPPPRAVRVQGARVTGHLDLEAATLRCPLHLHACFLECQEPVTLREATAQVVRLTACRLPSGLDATQLRTAGDLNLDQVRTDGEVRLLGAHIGGQLNLTGGKFRNRNPGGDAISADTVQVDESLFCGEGFEADGQVRLLGAHIGGQLNLTGGKFRNRNPGGRAISADRVQVDQGLFCGEGFEADGEVWLNSAHVGVRLGLTGKFRNRNPGGDAVSAEGLRIEGSADWRPKEVIGWLNLGFARATVWADDATGRATPTALGGFRYDALHPGPDYVGADERIAWLDRDPTGYSPQPYAQLAAIYRAEGHDRHARTVLIASQNRRRRRRQGWRSWPGRAWGRLLWGAVGYGYRPWLALLWLLVLITVGTLVISSRPDAELTPGPGAPARNALLYTVNALVPFVDLGYRKWVAHGTVVVVTAVLVVLGWVLATAVTAAFTGVLRRGD